MTNQGGRYREMTNQGEVQGNDYPEGGIGESINRGRYRRKDNQGREVQGKE